MWICFLLLQLIWPVCCIIARLAQLEFHLYSESVYYLLVAAISFLLWKKCVKSSPWVIAVFPVTVLVCGWEILMTKSFLAIPSAIVRCGCAYAMLEPLEDKWYNFLAKGICGLLIIGMIGLCGFDLTFGSIGRITVIQEAISPDGTCTAQLIDDDQGALGGSTLVHLIHKDILSLGIGGFRPMTRTIYHSGWGEYQTMTLSWKDNTTLLINNEPFPID